MCVNIYMKQTCLYKNGNENSALMSLSIQTIVEEMAAAQMAAISHFPEEKKTHLPFK